jgi:hypothetical protein
MFPGFAAAIANPASTNLPGIDSPQQSGSAERVADKADKIASLPKMFLICSHCVLCSHHEQSILSCPQAPAGHGALRAGGCDFSFS